NRRHQLRHETILSKTRSGATAPLPVLDPPACAYDAGASAVPMLVKIAFTFVPATPMTVTETSTSSAYSSKSCPSSARANFLRPVMNFISVPPARELTRTVACAKCGHGNDGD